MKKWVCGFTVVAAIAAFGVTGALAARAAVIDDCAGSASSAPTQLVLFCGDGNDTLTGISWSRWGAATTTASAKDVVNLCQPNCADGHDRDYRVHVSATALRRGRYERLTVTFTGSRPKGLSRVEKFELTTRGPVIS